MANGTPESKTADKRWQELIQAVELKQNGLLDELEVLLESPRLNSLHVTGRGGTGKSYTVTQFLTRLFGEPNVTDGKWAYVRGHLSPMGLFHFASKHRDQVIVFDDVTELFRDTKNQGYLLTLMEPGLHRQLTYVRSIQPTKMNPRGGSTTLRFNFTGKVISIANYALGGDPVRDAIADRCTTVELDYTNEEMGALLYKIACTGPNGTKRTDAQYVLDIMLGMCREYDVRPTLRLFLDKAMTKYRSHQRGIGTRVNWIDRLRADIAREAAGTAVPVSTDARQKIQDEIVIEVCQKFPKRTQSQDRLAEFYRLTESRLGAKQSRATYFDIKRRLTAEKRLKPEQRAAHKIPRIFRGFFVSWRTTIGYDRKRIPDDLPCQPGFQQLRNPRRSVWDGQHPQHTEPDQDRHPPVNT